MFLVKIGLRFVTAGLIPHWQAFKVRFVYSQRRSVGYQSQGLPVFVSLTPMLACRGSGWKLHRVIPHMIPKNLPQLALGGPSLSRSQLMRSERIWAWQWIARTDAETLTNESDRCSEGKRQKFRFRSATWTRSTSSEGKTCRARLFHFSHTWLMSLCDERAIKVAMLNA